ncbi:hypothetical protein B5F04_00570 [Limosilactobacillus reuteri]|uniref:hypothetical protein n=1 Tax=Limosilactobacillus reuteri TaxID=1598 RepID=UPI000B39CE4C|nr:hypothetical protein [Limosilactobacillus reuteri]OUP90873.1 hypothetical protein B5F04_00570 [Limosilactobacillus reuteri]
MQKIKAFVVSHKLITVICLFVAVYGIAGISYLADQHRKQQQFYREHPLVNKVYKHHYREKPEQGPWTEGTFYYIFGDNEYRDKVLTVYHGGKKRVKEILRDKNEYDKEFRDNAERYIVEDGDKLIIGDSPENVYNHQVKDGKNWVGMYNPDDKNDEEPGEFFETTPVNID